MSWLKRGCLRSGIRAALGESDFNRQWCSGVPAPPPQTTSGSRFASARFATRTSSWLMTLTLCLFAFILSQTFAQLGMKRKHRQLSSHQHFCAMQDDDRFGGLLVRRYSMCVPFSTCSLDVKPNPSHRHPQAGNGAAPDTGERAPAGFPIK